MRCQMAVVLEAMTDGGVLVGIPKTMAQRVAAQTMMVCILLCKFVRKHCMCS